MLSDLDKMLEFIETDPRFSHVTVKYIRPDITGDWAFFSAYRFKGPLRHRRSATEFEFVCGCEATTDAWFCLESAGIAVQEEPPQRGGEEFEP